MRRPTLAAILLPVILLLTACASGPLTEIGGNSPVVDTETAVTRGGIDAMFAAVVARVEPEVEQVCRQRAEPGTDCDFLIGLDTRPGIPANGFQTLDALGRPVVILTRSLVAEASNPDEIAFALAHEAAHHIEGHIGRTRVAALRGQAVAGALAQASGANAMDVRRAAELGLAVGARRYSKTFELEADALGTVIARDAGFDPVRGVEFFTRLPDPGDRFLGTHPPNDQRIAAVRRIAAGL